MRFDKTAAKTSVLSITAVCVILIAGGPVGCDTTGPGGGSGFPGNQEGSDDREVLIFPEEWDPTNPVWSPSCDRVAFEKSYGGYRVICIYDVATDTYEDLSATVRAPLLGDWSHNGEWIQYGTTDTWDVFVIRPDGSDNTRIYDGGGSSGIFLEGSFSPDDREIAFDVGSGAVVLDISDLSNIGYRSLNPWPDDDFHMAGDTGG
jgi:Tol biopolymer transport system component